MWHGEADQLIMPKGTLNYYHRLLSGNGSLKHVDDTVRLFLAPGVAHCGGGAGPNPVGTFEAVVDWVENGNAPDTIMASRTLPGGALRTRPLCAYPKTAQWTGLGSTDSAANFVCVGGQHDAADFQITGPGLQLGKEAAMSDTKARNPRGRLLVQQRSTRTGGARGPLRQCALADPDADGLERRIHADRADRQATQVEVRIAELTAQASKKLGKSRRSSSRRRVGMRPRSSR